MKTLYLLSLLFDLQMILVALALVAVAVAVPVEQPIPQIVRSNFDQRPEGGYSFG